MVVRAIVLVFVLGLSACSTARVEPASQEPTTAASPAADRTTPAASPSTSTSVEWQEPAAYSFTIESRCGWQSLPGRFRVTVEDGEVVDVEALDDQGRRIDTPLPTIDEILERAAEARRGGADEVHVSTDPLDGHPVSVEIDWRTNLIDDEVCYEVSDFDPAGE